MSLFFFIKLLPFKNLVSRNLYNSHDSCSTQKRLLHNNPNILRNIFDHFQKHVVSSTCRLFLALRKYFSRSTTNTFTNRQPIFVAINFWCSRLCSSFVSDRFSVKWEQCEARQKNNLENCQFFALAKLKSLVKSFTLNHASNHPRGYQRSFFIDVWTLFTILTHTFNLWGRKSVFARCFIKYLSKCAKGLEIKSH